MLSLPLNFELSSIKDGSSILDISRKQITTLNSTGGFVWERLQRGLTVEQSLQETYVRAMQSMGRL